jgi:outer membrane protein assembly factor BamB
MYLTTSAGRLEARDTSTGAILWAAEGIAWLQGFDTSDNNSPAVVGGLVVASGQGNTLRAFDLASGPPRWSVSTALPPAGPPVASQGTIYQVSGGNELAIGNSVFEGLTAYDAASGTVLWAREWTTSG